MAAAAKHNIVVFATLLLFPIILSSVQGERVWFQDEQSHQIDRDYEAHNIFIVNGTNVSLESGSITAPESGDDGEDAVRVEDATFHAKNGKIFGGLGLGGTGVTISTTRNSDYPPGTAIFEAGVEVYGGDATRDETTKGGDAVQVLQSDSTATFNGGKFVPGLGCTIKVCGTTTDNGVALQVIEGEAIVKGGNFEGVLYNYSGRIEVHGCVVYDKGAQKITGVLLDGSNIEVNYGQPKGSDRPPVIVYQPELCPKEAPDSPLSSNRGANMNPLAWFTSSLIFILEVILTLQL